MTTATKTRSLGVRMPETWHDQLLAIAVEQGTSRNDIMLRAIALLIKESTASKS